MKQQAEYYQSKLYPFQNKILSIVSKCKNNFYLTGGTALGRFYLKHRYSDDIDLFLNNAKDFNAQADKIFENLIKSKLVCETISKSNDFRRIVCGDEQVELKIDFVNDVDYHTGELVRFKTYPRVDNWKNILVNKITALDRREPKDVADILFLSKNYKFKWDEIFEEALKKVNYIDPLDTSTILNEFPAEFLDKILWTGKINKKNAMAEIKIISKDIIRKNINSLC